jgi:OOP family OmpA-OmpF porin
MMPKSINVRTVISVLIGMSAGSAMAQAVNPDGYMIDQRGGVARSGTGLCWRSAEWTPAKATAECDPDLVKKPEPTPVPVAAAPAPAPAPAAPPPMPKCKFGAALAADTTFAFGKSDLTPTAKSQLDALIKDTSGRCGSVSSVRVVGHTDMIGSDKANQKLSEQRAAAVKGYLQSKGMNPPSFEAVGVGESQPLANVTCAKKLKKAKLVECLAPNRRVIIDVQGIDK